MKLGKAAGVDNIETEHLVYAHPGLCVLLSLLFNCIWWFIAGYHTDLVWMLLYHF